MSRAEDALRQQKEAKQKKVLFILLPLFLLLVAWQGPKCYKALTASSSPPPEPAATTPTTTGAQAPIDPASAPPPSTAAAPATEAKGSGPKLSDTDQLAEPGADQVESFSLFGPQNPFIPRSGPPLPYMQAAPTTTGSTSSSTTGATTASTSTAG